jgi:transcriptional regulator with XRE-family HTH domain
MMGERSSDEVSSFGVLLRRHRLSAGLSQEHLAELAAVSSEGISALERGYRRSPHRETVTLLAAALNLSEDERNAFEAAASVASSRRQQRTFAHEYQTFPAEARVPVALTSFVGRSEELADICALLDRQRLVTLVGTTGIGKTQTAIHAAERLLNWWAGQVAFVDACGLASSDHGALASYAQYKPTLLILDGCERNVDAIASLSEALLMGAYGLRILATSLVPLRVPGEQVYALPPLTTEAAIVLFEERAQAVDHRFTITAENRLLVERICRTLDGSPKGIEMTSSRVAALSLEALLDTVILHASGCTDNERIASMCCSLSKDESRVFDRLVMLESAITLEEVARICADDVPRERVPVLIATLVEKSFVLVDLSEGKHCYRVPWMIRYFGRAEPQME